MKAEDEKAGTRGRVRPRRATDPRAGQALAEFVIALVVILVVFAGILQIGSLGLHQTQLMSDARGEAGNLAMMAQATLSPSDYILDRTVGPDLAPYSKDDDLVLAYAGDLQGGIVDFAHPQELQARLPNNPVSTISASPAPESQFGLVRGHATRTRPLLPVITDLLYARDSIRLEGTAWLTWTTGIY